MYEMAFIYHTEHYCGCTNNTLGISYFAIYCTYVKWYIPLLK